MIDPLLRKTQFLLRSKTLIVYYLLHVIQDVTKNIYWFVEFLCSNLQFLLSTTVQLFPLTPNSYRVNVESVVLCYGCWRMHISFYFLLSWLLWSFYLFQSLPDEFMLNIDHFFYELGLVIDSWSIGIRSACGLSVLAIDWLVIGYMLTFVGVSVLFPVHVQIIG